MEQLYASIAPKPDDSPVLVTKLGELLRRDHDWSKGVTAIKAPTLIVVGDADSVRTAHAVQFFELLGGGKADAGWDGSAVEFAAGHPACHDALRHLHFTCTGVHRHAVPGRAFARGQVTGI